MDKKIIIGIVVIVLLGLAYYLISSIFIVKEINEDLPPLDTGAREIYAQGNFVPSAHDVVGIVKLLRESGRGDYLRFEDFETVNGPDLYIYLATDTTADDFVSLGKIKATKGNVNYAIPAGTDLAKYDTVLVWCKQFRVLFSYADLE